jgi:hypothetical protein
MVRKITSVRTTLVFEPRKKSEVKNSVRKSPDTYVNLEIYEAYDG